MNYWLMKTEPTTFGIDDLINMPRQTEHWDGIRNYQARNMIRDQMRMGDLAFFYHSNCKEPGIVGTMEIVKEAYPDFTAFDPESDYFDPKSSPDNPRWFMPDVTFKEKFKDNISLAQLKQNPSLEEMLVLRKGSRLSITPVTEQQWQSIMGMSRSS